VGVILLLSVLHDFVLGPRLIERLRGGGHGEETLRLRRRVALLARLKFAAGRNDEARALIERMPAATPEERVELAATRDMVEFYAGGADDLEGIRAAVAELEPADGDARLRGEVMIASSITRRRMADGRAAPGDAIDPLIAVRERLGRRADGQLGRALRRRLLAVFLASSLIFGLLFELVGGGFGIRST